MNPEFIETLQERLDWYVDTEQYEIAARWRDRIASYSDNDPEAKQRYISYLEEKYGPIKIPLND